MNKGGNGRDEGESMNIDYEAIAKEAADNAGLLNPFSPAYIKAIIDAYERQKARPELVPLTDEQIADCVDSSMTAFRLRYQGPTGQQVTPRDSWNHWFARAIEAAHGIKGA